MSEEGTNGLIQDLIKKSFIARSFSEKQQIIEKGRPRPCLPSLICKHREEKREYIKYFQPSEYDKTIWLAGCAVVQRVYCWPCLLLGADRENVWTKEGYNNLNMLSHAITMHEKSLCHIRASLELSSFGRTRIDVAANQQYNEAVMKNREILKKLIDCICYLARQDLPFKGYTGNDPHESIHERNYIQLLHHLCEYDTMLVSQLKENAVFREKSLLILDELIECISNALRNAIKKEVSRSEFVSILLDETTDVINKSQLSTSLRYVNDIGELQERFIHFSDVSANRTVEALYDHIVNIVKDFGLETKLIGQTYDGALVATGQINCLQKRLQEMYPLATFTHCYRHVSDLILQQSVCAISECRIFFKTLSGVSLFFSSPSRTHALKQFLEKKMTRTAPWRTQWNFNSAIINTVQEVRHELIMFFGDIIAHCEDWDSVSISQALGFISFLSNFKTIFLLEVFSSMICQSDLLLNVMQKETFDTVFHERDIARFKEQLLKQRSNFEPLWRKLTLNMTNEPPVKRLRRNEDAEFRWLYYRIIDTVSNQISERLRTCTKFEFVELLNEKRFQSYKSFFPEMLLYNLSNGPYCNLFDFVKLKNELITLYSSSEFENRPVHQLVSYMYANNIHNILSETYKLASLILLVRYTIASVKQSSALRRVNHYCRAVQSQEKLRGLGILSIEKELLSKMKSLPSFYDDVIREFTTKNRRPEFELK